MEGLLARVRRNRRTRIHSSNEQTVSNLRGKTLQKGNGITNRASKEAVRLSEGGSMSHKSPPLI